MPKISDGSILVWNMAATEAIHARLPQIEPGHLLVALCKIGDVPLADMPLADVPLAGEDKDVGRLPLLKLEVVQIEECFAGVGLDVRRFRRRLRAELGRGTAPEQKIIHRSEATRQVFEAAEEFCLTHHLNVVRPVHLLIALCEQDEWHSLLRECRVDPARLHRAARAAGRREPQVRDSPKAGGHASSTPMPDKYGRDPVLSRGEQLSPLAEVLGGIGRVIYLQPLEPNAVREIIDTIVDNSRAPLSKRGLKLTLDSGVYEFLMKRGYNDIFGARDMERTVERLLIEPLSRLILEGDCSPGTRFQARAENDKIVFEVVSRTSE